ncbi:MAG: DUF350 domain-containing protein [Planctomycetales bacterium]|nr:DUF350 domain-containing protein [Planctomycetales bacterium]
MNLFSNYLFAALEMQAETGIELNLLWHHLLLAVVFSVVGVIVFGISLLILEKLTPFSMVKEISEEHNIAVAIVVAAIVFGISIIIGASILG